MQALQWWLMVKKICLCNNFMHYIFTGAPSILKGNFYPFLYLIEGSDRTFITNIISDLPLSEGSPSWYGFNRNLPKGAQVSVSHDTDGTIHSIMKLHNLSYYDDSGEYVNSASNKCGTTTKSVFIAVRKSESPQLLFIGYIMTFRV